MSSFNTGMRGAAAMVQSKSKALGRAES